MDQAAILLAAGHHENPLVVFDLDGTLYDQQRLRWFMALHMVHDLLWSFKGRRQIKIIRWFRRLRETLAETEAEDIINLQYAMVASELSISEEEVRVVIKLWMLEKPLKYLRKCREPYVEYTFGQLHRAGKIIAVLSDYPAHEKLMALGLHADIIVAATDAEVNRFKPHPKGLLRVLDLAGTVPERCVVIGDREDRDGECARRIGAPFILKRPFRQLRLPEVNKHN